MALEYSVSLRLYVKGCNRDLGGDLNASERHKKRDTICNSQEGIWGTEHRIGREGSVGRGEQKH